MQNQNVFWMSEEKTENGTNFHGTFRNDLDLDPVWGNNHEEISSLERCSFHGLLSEMSGDFSASEGHTPSALQTFQKSRISRTWTEHCRLCFNRHKAQQKLRNRFATNSSTVIERGWNERWKAKSWNNMCCLKKNSKDYFSRSLNMKDERGGSFPFPFSVL